MQFTGAKSALPPLGANCRRQERQKTVHRRALIELGFWNICQRASFMMLLPFRVTSHVRNRRRHNSCQAGFLRLLGVMPLNTGNISRTNEKSHLFYCAAESVPPPLAERRDNNLWSVRAAFRAREPAFRTHVRHPSSNFCALRQSDIYIYTKSNKRKNIFDRQTCFSIGLWWVR